MRHIGFLASIAVSVVVGVAAQVSLAIAKELHRLSLWLIVVAIWLVKKPAPNKETP